MNDDDNCTPKKKVERPRRRGSSIQSPPLIVLGLCQIEFDRGDYWSILVNESASFKFPYIRHVAGNGSTTIIWATDCM